MRAALTVAMLLALAACAAPRGAKAPASGVAARPAVRTPSQPAVAAWRPRPVIADARATPARTIVPAAGDTLAAIAARAGVSPGAIAVANKLRPGAPIAAGARLTVPAGRYHAVKTGETGLAIARAYGTPWRRIVAANGLAAPYTLEIGDRLLIPPRVAAQPTTIEQRAIANRVDIDDLITGSEPARVARSTPSPRPPASRPAALPPAAPAVAAIRLDWPVEGRVLSAFGRKPGGRFNDGVNIAVVAGAPVKAAADGVVVYAGSSIAAFGGLVLIRHDGGWVTAYAHNDALGVARGERVTRGQVIARAGATGEVDGPQLHFEVRRGRTPVDPLGLLPRRGVG